MKDAKKLNELEIGTGFSRVLKSLTDTLRSILSAVGIVQLITDLNDRTIKEIKVIKDAMTSATAKPAKSLRKLTDAKSLLQKAKDNIANMKSNLGLVDSDFEKIIDNNVLKSPATLILAFAVVVLDALVGGMLVYNNNQSHLTSALLWTAAALAAYFFYLAAPGFSVSHRMKSEIKRANHQIKGTLGMATKTEYENNPELALPYWMRPSSAVLSHNEGDIYYENGKWNIKRNNTMSWLWLAIGSLFSFLRLLPVLVDPTLYGAKAILWQFVILLIALMINAVILLIELWRRKDVGLPDALQKQVNTELRNIDTAKAIIGDGVQEEKFKSDIAVITDKTNGLLSDLAGSYANEFDVIVAKKNNLNALLSDYEEEYRRDASIITAFYDGLPATGFSKEQYEAQIPSPEFVRSNYAPSNEDDFEGKRLSPDLFKLLVVEPINN